MTDAPGPAHRIATSASSGHNARRSRRSRHSCQPIRRQSRNGPPRKPLPPLAPGEVRLLSGGNPQISKGDGNAPVQAWIKAIPGWKSSPSARIDALIMETEPQMTKAMRWNSPFYGMPDQGWTISLHGFTAFLRVTFLRGAHLSQQPPGPSKYPDTRYLDLRETDALDAAQFADWVRQSARIPGWIP